MSAVATQSLMDELEGAIQTGSPERRGDTLRRVADLFLLAPAHLNNEQIGLFDSVLTLLITRVESRARAELAKRLAPVEQAPSDAIRRLAHDDEIAVAGPVLTQSSQLTTQDLAGIAGQKGQDHLLAIAGRAHVEEQVTDVLIDRGNRAVIHKLAANDGAAFSEAGYSTLVQRADGDETLAEKLGCRIDIPFKMLRALLQRATEAVRERLLVSVSPERQEVLRAVLAEISGAIARESPEGRSIEDAKRLAQTLKQNGRLNEGELARFARQRKQDEAIAALALLCGAPFELIDQLMDSARDDALLVPCKAAGLDWLTVRALLELRGSRHAMSEHDVEAAANEFTKLTPRTAGRVLRFWQVRLAAGSQPTQPMQ